MAKRQDIFCLLQFHHFIICVFCLLFFPIYIKEIIDVPLSPSTTAKIQSNTAQSIGQVWILNGTVEYRPNCCRNQNAVSITSLHSNKLADRRLPVRYFTLMYAHGKENAACYL